MKSPTLEDHIILSLEDAKDGSWKDSEVINTLCKRAGYLVVLLRETFKDFRFIGERHNQEDSFHIMSLATKHHILSINFGHLSKYLSLWDYLSLMNHGQFVPTSKGNQRVLANVKLCCTASDWSSWLLLRLCLRALVGIVAFCFFFNYFILWYSLCSIFSHF